MVFRAGRHFEAALAAREEPAKEPGLRVELVTGIDVKVGDEIWEPGLGFQTVTEIIEQHTEPNDDPFLIRCADSGERYDYDEPILRRVEELPGDGQLATRVYDIAQELEQTPEDALSAIIEMTEPFVRDTEREHEPSAEAIEAYLARRVFEEKKRAEKAERQAEVLAKALDKFFTQDARMSYERADDLCEETEPTLRALGHGKGEAS